ncbi:MAG: Ig-like domain-containing protein [Thermoleophilia bacterium]
MPSGARPAAMLAILALAAAPAAAHGDRQNRPPTPKPDVATITEDAAPSVSGNVLANDTDPDRDRLAVVRPGTYSLVYGRITIAANGDFTYSLNNTNRLVNSLRAGQSRLELIPYVVSDGRGKLAASLLTITIRGANDASLAVDDTNGVREDSAPNPITGNVLGNDSDAEGDRLTVSNPGTFALGHGSLVLRADGSYSYTLDNTDPQVDRLNAGDSLIDEFTYNVSDGRGGTATAKLSITITGVTDNQAPVAVDDTNSVREDTAPNPVSGNVLGNDSDADSDALTVTNVGTFTLAHGSLVLRADGSYSYTLDNTDPQVNGLNGGDSWSIPSRTTRRMGVVGRRLRCCG